MTDIVFLSVPRLLLTGPILSIHLLKSCALEAGFSAKAFDFNAWFAREVKAREKGTDLAEAWSNPESNLLTDEEAIKSIEGKYILYWNKFFEEKIRILDPKIIGLTAFSYWTYPSIIIIAKQIREENPNIKILVGGPGVRQGKTIIKIRPYIDDYISGDAELSVVEYLKGNMNFPGINSFNYDSSFDRTSTPIPNYDDLDIELYNHNDPIYSLVGSRGCVRKCAFCNVPAIWKKFLWKPGKQNAEEIIFLYKKYNARNFQFTDSLINGNLKEYMALLEEVASFREKNKDVDFTITGQFICREKHQVKDEMFDLMSRAGHRNVTIGIESGSEKVRREMKKYFSNDSIEYHLQQMIRTGLKMLPLMFVGFPTETDEDFEETIKLLDMFKKYPKAIHSDGVCSDTPMMILWETPVANNLGDYHVTEFVDVNNWTSKFSDRKKRIERHYIFLHEAQKRGFWSHSQLRSDKTYTMAEEYMKFENPKKEVIDIINLWYQD